MFGDIGIGVSTMVHFAGIQRTLKEQQVIENEAYLRRIEYDDRVAMARQLKEKHVVANEHVTANRGKQ